MAITICEVGPRDGLQNEKTLLPTETKVTLIQRAVAGGVRRVEATAFVHPKRVPQMADAEQVMAQVPRDSGVSYIGLVLNRRGFERAARAGVDEVNMVVLATETFSERNQGMTVEASLRAWSEIAGLAHEAGIRPSVTLSAAFGCPFEGEVSPDRVRDLARRVVESGPAEIALADTIGVGVPTQVTELVAAVRDVAPGVALRCHFHNTRNTGYANAVAAVSAGVETLDASAGGIGGCPFAPAATGNIATEDLVYLLDRMGVATGVDLGELAATGRWIGEQLGIDVPALLGRAGTFPG
ncbi:MULTISPECIES: hydroxymethylglutaryl-CoA lyase [Parafrankia]|uniref:Hydroxymethylglutaryl-CoA lyase n=1 Tax=Parafrankia soli TaxID=2599596 RepID=A0A1S1PHU9_9ACTN|nr:MULTISPECIES: hydroxymethylglutaryl-CoA lyase [Parafrankia]OHV20182.1 hydroxymethylglutaryl-CoA lyase [Parafrankia soli]TCJ33713.1 hydroxymethylglutaryl-CoA lyase [Parafrankia sp. BMG5.11]CAI7974612.1 (R)-citramalyl-CoA lyase [Frankia sp. Hr75.2]SQD98217.1 Hydroxymethylglutaryl-CoA lyase [Parafrankia sp. Ea1.12]